MLKSSEGWSVFQDLAFLTWERINKVISAASVARAASKGCFTWRSRLVSFTLICAWWRWFRNYRQKCRSMRTERGKSHFDQIEEVMCWIFSKELKNSQIQKKLGFCCSGKTKQEKSPILLRFWPDGFRNVGALRVLTLNHSVSGCLHRSLRARADRERFAGCKTRGDCC